MTDHFYAHAAARLLAHGQTDEKHQPGPSESGASTVAAMEKEILNLARRRPARSPRVWLAAAAGLALAVGLGVGWHIARPSAPPASCPRVSVRVEGQQDNYKLVRAAVVGDGVEASEMLPGDRVQTASGDGTNLILSTGTQLAIAGQSEVQLRDSGRASQRFWLESGGLRATVAKLGPQERFLVQTFDSEIEVHGTVFSVKVGPAPGAHGVRTRVCLEEGAVLWRQEGRETKMIASNGHPVGCGEPAAESGLVPSTNRPDSPSLEGPRVGARTAAGLAGPKVRARAVPAGAIRESPQSSLAQQNDLFTAAMAAEREGNLAQAIARLETLLARFPDGSLAESAKAEVARLRHSKMPSATDF
jgi:hypothetical protein